MTEATQTEGMKAQDILEYEESDYAAEVKKRIKLDAWYPVEVISYTKGVAPESGNLSMQLTCAPLGPEGEILRKGALKLDVYPNLINKQVPGHKRPDTFFGCYCLCRTLIENFPQLPHKAGNSGMYETADGRIVTAQEASAMRGAIEIAVQKQMTSFYNNADTQLKGKRFYAFATEKKSKKGTVYAAWSKTLADRPTDEPVIEDGNIFAEE